MQILEIIEMGRNKYSQKYIHYFKCNTHIDIIIYKQIRKHLDGIITVREFILLLNTHT